MSTRAVATGMEQVWHRAVHESRFTRAKGEQSSHLVQQAVLGAEGGDELLRLLQVVARQRGEQVVLNLPVQTAREPGREQVSQDGQLRSSL